MTIAILPLEMAPRYLKVEMRSTTSAGKTLCYFDSFVFFYFLFFSYTLVRLKEFILGVGVHLVIPLKMVWNFSPRKYGPFFLSTLQNYAHYINVLYTYFR
jgi:hypothetical protein